MLLLNIKDLQVTAKPSVFVKLCFNSLFSVSPAYYGSNSNPFSYSNVHYILHSNWRCQ